jgi:hypothetical protein
MNIKLGNLIHGGGRRRATTESYADLGKENRQLRDDASRLDPCMCQNPGRHVEFLIRRPVGATAPVVPFGCPACLVDQLRGQHRAQLSVLTAPSAPPSPVLVPAAADVVGSAFAEPALVAVSDPRLRIVADTPSAPDESEASDVNAETQAVAVSSLWDAIGEGATTLLPAVDEPSSAVHLENAVAAVPPKPQFPPAHLVEQQLVTWRPTFAADPLAHDDLKAEVTTGGLPRASVRVQLAKAN